MNSVLLDFVWSGILIGESFTQFWYIMPATIVIEMVLIKLMTHHLWGKSLLISIVGNLFSGVIGTIVIGCASILVDFLFGSDFFPTMLITWLLMFAGSFGLEYIMVRWIFKDKSRALMWAVFIGNLLSYCFIAVSLVISFYIK